MSSDENKIHESSGNIFLDLGFPPEEAANLLLRSALAAEIERYIRAHELKQREAAEALGVSQPEISYIMTGKLDKFSLDKLVNMLARVGKQVTVEVLDMGAPA